MGWEWEQTFGWHGNGNGIETYGNEKKWKSWKPFPFPAIPHTSSDKAVTRNFMHLRGNISAPPSCSRCLSTCIGLLSKRLKILKSIVAMEYKYIGNRTILKLSNDIIFNDLAWPLMHNSWSRHYSTLNVTETLVTIEGRYTHALIDDVISNDLERPWLSWQNIQRHQASRAGLSATAELPVIV